MNQEILELLIRSLDEELNETDKKKLDDALSASEDLRVEKERLFRLRNDIAESAEKEFEPFFAEKVLNRIEAENRPAVKRGNFEKVFDHVFRRFALLSTAFLILLVLELKPTLHNFLIIHQDPHLHNQIHLYRYIQILFH